MRYNEFVIALLECGFTTIAAQAIWKDLPRNGINPATLNPMLVRMTAVDMKQNRFRLAIPDNWFQEITQPGLCKTCGHKDHGTDYCNSRTLTGRCGCKLKEFSANGNGRC